MVLFCHKKTNNIIGEQNETDYNHYESYFLQHSRNLTTNIAEQPEELNEKVIESVLPN